MHTLSKFLLIVSLYFAITVNNVYAYHPNNYRSEDLISILSDSGIHGPEYSEIEADLVHLEQQYPNLAKHIVYGKSINGRNLNAIRIGQQKSNHVNNEPKNAIFIAGTTHGDEYLNIEDRLPRWFLENTEKQNILSRYIQDGGVIYIIPILNPDGYSMRRRGNAHFIDLNRDFDNLAAKHKGFTQPETIQLASFLESERQTQNLRFAVTMDYHCCAGALLRPYTFEGPELPSLALQKHDFVNTLSIQVFGGRISYGTAPTIVGYDAIGVSEDYYFEQFGATAFTFEGARGIENTFFDKHTQFWLAIINAISNKQL